MMVGEVRDLETARVAVQAALTGHMILSTLHTNNAASAVTRLLDMGIEPFLITSTLNAVLAQRLVRRLCEVCREPYSPIAPIETRAEDGGTRRIEVDRLFHPKGCPACGGTGFHGRVALVELLVMDPVIARPGLWTRGGGPRDRSGRGGWRDAQHVRRRPAQGPGGGDDP